MLLKTVFLASILLTVGFHGLCQTTEELLVKRWQLADMSMNGQTLNEAWEERNLSKEELASKKAALKASFLDIKPDKSFELYYGDPGEKTAIAGTCFFSDSTNTLILINNEDNKPVELSILKITLSELQLKLEDSEMTVLLYFKPFNE